MSIFFLILKIAGILLLLLLVLLLLFLFHPIFYQVRGEWGEKKAAQGYFWWLFQILRLEFSVSDHQVKWRIRIFGCSREFQEAQEEEEGLERPDQKGDTEPAAEKATVQTEEPEEQKHRQAEEEEPSGEQGQEEAAMHAAKQKQGFWTRFGEFRKKMTEESLKKAMARLWRETVYLLSRLKPKEIQAEISFSTGDPAMTGSVTGMLALFPFLYRSGVSIYPDFLTEECYVKGQIRIKGHIAFYPFLRSLIRILLDRHVRRAYRILRPGGSSAAV